MTPAPSLVKIFLAFVAAGLSVAAACSDDSTPTRSVSTATQQAGTSTGTPTGTPTANLAAEQVLRIVLPGEPATIDPQRAEFTNDIAVIHQLFRGLLYFDPELDLVPDMAAELPTVANGGISADGLTYTFELREGLTWSDGSPLLASDIVYTLQRVCSPAYPTGYASYFDSIAGCAEYQHSLGTEEEPLTPTDAETAALRSAVGASTVDESTVVIALKHPQPTFLHVMALAASYPVKQSVVEANPDTWTEPGTIVGSGPFILQSWEHDQAITFAKNPNWWGEAFTLEGMEWRIVGDEGQQYAAYQAGEIAWSTVPLENVGVVRDDAELSKQNVSSTALVTIALEFNLTRPPFDNADVRKAFAAAIDREAYVASVAGGVGAPAYGWVPPGMPGYDASVGKQYAVDAAAAQQFLTDAGFPAGAGLPPVVLTIPESQTSRTTAEFIQSQLKQNLGIEIEIEVLEAKTFQQRFGEADYQATVGGWSADYPDPEAFLVPVFTGGANPLMYANDAVDALFGQAESELDTAKRLDLLGQAHRVIIDDDAVLVPLFHRGVNILVQPWVTGITLTPVDALPGDLFYYRTQILSH